MRGTFSDVLAPAKINLTLEILARRDDGYHALRSVMVPIALCDELTIAPSDAFTFTCVPEALAPDNLVLRALALLVLRLPTTRLRPWSQILASCVSMKSEPSLSPTFRA